MECPDCGVSRGRWHKAGCAWEQCPHCGNDLAECGHKPPLDDRLVWDGTCFWLDACLSLGFFKKRVSGVWVACPALDPDSLPDLGGLLQLCRWSRAEKRFERRRMPLRPAVDREA